MKNNEIKIEKTFIRMIGEIVAIASVVVGIVLFIVVPQYNSDKEIALIKNDLEKIISNDLNHTAKEADMQELFKINEEQHKAIELKLERIITILGE